MIAAVRPVAKFDHRDSGTSEEEWVSSGLIEHVRKLDVSGLRRLLVVAAHPDDESLGAGGLMAMSAGLGVEVAVLICSAGEASHPRSRTHSPDRLASMRRAEASAAVASLAPTGQVEVLDLPDGRLAGVMDVLAAEILRRTGCGGRGTWLVVPWRDDNHPDHAAVSAAAQRVAGSTGCRLLEYPIWAWHWARPGDGVLESENLVAVELSEVELRAKRRALSMYHTQVEPLSDLVGDEAVVPPGFRRHFWRYREVFVDAAVPAAARAGWPEPAAVDRRRR